QRGGSPVAGRTAGGMAARGPGRIPRHLAGAGPAGVDDAGATAVAGVAGHAFGGRPAWRREGARPSAGEPGPVRQFAAAPGSRRSDTDRGGAGLAGPALPALQPGFLGRLLGRPRERPGRGARPGPQPGSAGRRYAQRVGRRAARHAGTPVGVEFATSSVSSPGFEEYLAGAG